VQVLTKRFALLPALALFAACSDSPTELPPVKAGPLSAEGVRADGLSVLQPGQAPTRGPHYSISPTSAAGAACLQANFDLTSAGFRGAPANFAILSNTGGQARTISSVDLYMAARTTPHDVAVSIWSRAGTGNLAPAAHLGSGTVSVGTTHAVYSADISPTVNLPAATDFFIVFDNAAAGGLILPISSSGTGLTHYWNGPPIWNGPFFSARWSYRINCGVEVDIDIKPGSDPNAINPRSNAVVPVAILGRDDFDVTDVDVTTLAFGPAGAPPANNADHLQDVNRDGYNDLVSHYRQREAGIGPGDNAACVTGATVAGVPFAGCDAVAVGLTEKATGSGHFRDDSYVEPELRTFAFTALEKLYGGTTGQWEIHNRNQNVTAHGTIVCMSVSAVEGGARAWLGGTITWSDNEVIVPIGYDVAMVVADNGEGIKAKPDSVSFAQTLIPGTAEGFCANQPWHMLNPIEDGNIQIH